MKKYLYYLFAVVLAVMFPLTTACSGDDDVVGVTGVTLTPGAVTLYAGQTRSLEPSVLPGNATNTNVTWQSSNPGVASVSDGTVTAIAEGYATITVKTEDGDKTADCAVVVAVSVDSVSVMPFTASLLVGQTQTLTANVLPLNATNKDITWESSNPGAAAVLNGTITALSAGEATITAKTVEGAKTAHCLVNVRPASYAVPVASLTLNPTTMALGVGQQQPITPTVLPGNATNKNLVWTSSNFAIATVANGTVTAIAPGQAIITAATEDGGLTAACAVAVNSVPLTGLSLKPKTALGVNYMEQFRPVFTPDNATNKNLTWSSSDTSVVTVSNGGLVKAMGLGTATVKAHGEGDIEASCDVTVFNVYGGIMLDNWHPVVSINNEYHYQITQYQIDNYVWGDVRSVFATESGDYYAAGWDDDTPGWARRRPVVWKNGRELYDLTTDTNFQEEWAEAVTVVGNDVYTAGYGIDYNWDYHPKLWKNNVNIPLENHYGHPYRTVPEAVSVANNGDVYVAGYVEDNINWSWQSAMLWINGNAYPVAPDTDWSSARSVFVSGDDVYVAGWWYGWDNSLGWYEYPVLWKNGARQILEVPQTINGTTMFAYYGKPEAVFVDGEDVYVAGSCDGYGPPPAYEGYIFPMLWKNGVVVPVEGQGQIYSLCVLDGNVFSGGIINAPMGRDDEWNYFIAYGGVFLNDVPHIYDGNIDRVRSVFATRGRPIAVTGVTVTPLTATIPVGGTQQLTATIAPANATNKNVVWSSSSANVTFMPATGLTTTITGVTAGSATITATTEDGSEQASAYITVTATAEVPVTGVTVTPLTANIPVGGTQQLTATIAPANATNKNVAWSSSSANVTFMPATGLTTTVTGVTAGSATITATTEDGNKTSSCAVTVTPSLNPDPIVYVAGYQQSNNANYANLAHVWINGAPHKRDTGGTGSEAWSVFVSEDNKEYVGGWEYDDDGAAIIYVDGVRKTLQVPLEFLYPFPQLCSIFVSDGHEYVAGYMMDFPDKAIIWKDGQPRVLNTEKSRAQSVFVDGGRVYVAGHEGTYYQEVATLWIDDDPPLHLETWEGHHTEAKSVFVSGGNVYACGYNSDSNYNFWPAFWINGVLYHLPTAVGSPTTQVGFSVHVSGNKAYVTGGSDNPYYVYRPSLWEITLTANGGGIVETREIPLTTDGTYTLARSVFVYGDTAYVAGYGGGAYQNQNSRATLWRVSNGIVTDTTRLAPQVESQAFSVFVK